MKKMIFLLFALQCCSAECVVSQCNRPELANMLAYPQEKQNDSLRVISYNLRWDMDIDKQHNNGWDVRKYKVKMLIDYYQPDVLAMQEVEDFFIDDLLAFFPNLGVVMVDQIIYPHRPSLKDPAIAYNKQKFEIVASGYFWLSLNLTDPYPAWDNVIPLPVIWVELVDKKTKKKFKLFTTHFDIHGDQSRLEGARMLTAIAQDCVGSVIIAGDFNLFSHRNGQEGYLQFLQSGIFTDVRDSAVAHYGPDGTWIGWPYDSYSVSAGRNNDRLDHIFTKEVGVIAQGVLGDKVDAAGTIAFQSCTKSEYANTALLYPSDHLPVIADITIN